MNIGITISIGRVQGSGGGSTPPPESFNGITVYYANGTTELASLPLPATISFTIPQYPTGV